MFRVTAAIFVCVSSTLVPLDLFARQDSAKAVEMSLEDIRVIVGRVGKGRSLQPDTWPGGARVAVLLSFDADDETVELRSGGDSINVLSDLQYGRAGLKRIVDLLDRHEIPASFFIPGVSLALMSDDSPFEILRNGEPTGIVELPVSWVPDDASYLLPRSAGAISPRDFLTILKDDFDVAYREGTTFLLTTHPDIIGRRSAIVILEELIDYIKSKPGVWFATHRAAAEYAAEQSTEQFQPHRSPVEVRQLTNSLTLYLYKSMIYVDDNF